jgi:hypothetical protein
MCTKLDSTICFCVETSHTSGVTEVEEMFSKDDSLEHEYMLNLRWTVTKMIQSYESDPQLAYIHGFDAAIALLGAKAKLSNPEISQGMKELADKMAEETAYTLRSMQEQKERLLQSQPRSRCVSNLESDGHKL